VWHAHLTARPYACNYTCLVADLTNEELELCARIGSTCAASNLRRATRGMTQLYDAALAPAGLKVTQLPLLVALSAQDLPITSLAETISLDRTTLTRNLRVLEQRGLVRTVAATDDARVRLASLTADGADVLSGALARWREVQAGVAARFGEDRLRALFDELEALSESAVP
jgi:DNA-binding MarR family transcriptional regulator